jgi:hypothetical protein
LYEFIDSRKEVTFMTTDERINTLKENNRRISTSVGRSFSRKRHKLK